MHIASAALKLLRHKMSAAHFSRVALMLNKDAPKRLSRNIQAVCAHLQMLYSNCQHTDYTRDTQILHGPNPDIAAAHARQDRCDMLHHGERLTPIKSKESCLLELSARPSRSVLAPGALGLLPCGPAPLRKSDRPELPADCI